MSASIVKLHEVKTWRARCPHCGSLRDFGTTRPMNREIVMCFSCDRQFVVSLV